MSRERFDKHLTDMKNKLYEMSEMAFTALNHAFEAFEQQNMSIADKVIEQDIHINKKEEELEDLAVYIINTEQPVATDLRKILSTLKIASSLERIGDFAVDMSTSTKHIGSQERIIDMHDFQLMYSVVNKMTKAGMDAYMEEDTELADDMAKMDDHIDDMYGNIIKKLFETTLDYSNYIEQAIQLAYIARYIERVADHATNISEAVFYIVNGERVKLNK